MVLLTEALIVLFRASGSDSSALLKEPFHLALQTHRLFITEHSELVHPSLLYKVKGYDRNKFRVVCATFILQFVELFQVHIETFGGTCALLHEE